MKLFNTVSLLTIGLLSVNIATTQAAVVSKTELLNAAPVKTESVLEQAKFDIYNAMNELTIEQTQTEVLAQDILAKESEMFDTNNRTVNVYKRQAQLAD